METPDELPKEGKQMKSRIVLGKCPECREEVITRDTFDVVVFRITGRSYQRYFHRDCNPRANHTKD